MKYYIINGNSSLIALSLQFLALNFSLACLKLHVCFQFTYFLNGVLMRVKSLLLLLLFVFAACVTNAQTLDAEYWQTNREVYFKFKMPQMSVAKELANQLSIDEVKDGFVYAYANKNEFESFNNRDIEYEVLTRPGVKDFVKMSNNIEELCEWDSYPTYEAYVDMMYQFATDYPDLCTVHNIGTTVEGRALLFVKISDNVTVKEAEPEFMYTSTMHGDETTGYVLMLRLIDYLLSNYGTDDEVTYLVDNLEIWINPAANPDGTYNGGNSTVNGATRSNANGYDINRNFPDWDDGPNPTGTWQPETIAMMEFGAAHNFSMSANFHGGAEVVNYPWDTVYDLHPDNDWYISVSRVYADAVHAASSGYMTGFDNGITNGADWYTVAGGRQDYYNYYLHCKEVTIELSDTKLPAGSQMPTFWNYNKQALLDYMKECTYGFGGIITSSLGTPLKAKIEVVGHDAVESYVMSDSTTGRYQRMIDAGTYDVEVSAEDHFTKTITDVTVVDGEFVNLDIMLVSSLGVPDTVAPDQVDDVLATEITSNSLKFTWTVPNDTSVGGIVDYDLRYSTSAIEDDTDFDNATEVEFSGTPAAIGETESITLTELEFSTTYYFAVKAKDVWSNYSLLSTPASATTYQAPELSVSPASIAHDTTVNTVMYDTVVVSNVTANNSTLDYTILLGDKGLTSENVKVRFEAVTSNEVSTSKGAKSVKGGAALKGSGGPDTFGYEWIDSDESNGPTYIWDDISTTGTVGSNWAATGTYGADDEGILGPLALGFDFEYYGTDYSEVYVSTNGFVSFDSFTGGTFSNAAIPGSVAPNSLIAAFWDDLKKGSGDVYYQQFSNKFVIQFNSWSKYSGSGEFTFQVVLYSNGKIALYYEDMPGDVTSCSVGIEDAAGNVGLQIVKDGSYLHDQLLVEFSAKPEWVLMDPAEGTIYNGNSVNMILEINTTDLETGMYSTQIDIYSNDPDNDHVVVPVNISVGTQGLVSLDVNVNSGWNLLSVPVAVADMSADFVFGDASGVAYGFNNNYYVAETLENGSGYWVKYENSSSVSLVGSKVSAPVEVNQDWNIIGFYDNDVATSSINSNPANLVSTVFYGYNNGYYVAETLKPGKGYWVKCNASGELTAGSKAAKSAFEMPNRELPAIILATENGAAIKLYLGYEGNVNTFSLPPLPPAGSFDARFANNAIVSNELNDNVKLQANEVVTLKAVNESLNISFNGNVVTLEAGETCTIPKGTSELFVSSVTIPTVYELSQNYPNPFNPSTTIKFALPVEAKVTVTLYNALGQRVNEIASNNFTAGVQTVNFNASELASGMYIYQISAQGVDGSNFVDTKKMMLMK